MTVVPLQVYVVRHGETAWSLSGQHTGRTDLPLTPQGEAMARARATCALAGFGFGGADVQIEPDLSEWDCGDCEGLRTAEIQEGHPGWYVWQDGCPGGETPAAVSARRPVIALWHSTGKGCARAA